MKNVLLSQITQIAKQLNFKKSSQKQIDHYLYYLQRVSSRVMYLLNTNLIVTRQSLKLDQLLNAHSGINGNTIEGLGKGCGGIMFEIGFLTEKQDKITGKYYITCSHRTGKVTTQYAKKFQKCVVYINRMKKSTATPKIKKSTPVAQTPVAQTPVPPVTQTSAQSHHVEISNDIYEKIIIIKEKAPEAFDSSLKSAYAISIADHLNPSTIEAKFMEEYPDDYAKNAEEFFISIDGEKEIKRKQLMVEMKRIEQELENL